jgi:integrase
MSRPKSPLTQADIAKLTCPPTRKSLEYTIDAIKVPGLFVAVRHTGGMTYTLRHRDANNCTRYSKIGRTTDISLSDAKKAALKLRAGILLGNYPGADKRDKQLCMTFTEFFEQKYLPFAKPRKRSWRDDHKLFEARLRDHDSIGPLPLNRITLEATERFLGELAEEGLADSTVRHHGQLLKRCMSLAVKWQVLDADPLSGLKLQQVHDAREYFLSDEELQRLLHVLRTNSARVPALAAQMLLFTGARLSELLNARYEDLDLHSSAPTWTVLAENSKSKRKRHIPLNEEALKVIDQLPSKGVSAYLFTNSRNGERLQGIDKAWQRLRKEAGLPTLRLHDLRHNFASMLVNSGESLYTVQRILGHQDPALSARYSHLSGTALHDAANSVTSYLDKALKKKGDTGQ